MKFLMLGATGYLGGNIVSKLIKAGHYAICVVRSTSDTSRLSLADRHIELIPNDLKQIEAKLTCTEVDWVINGVCTYKPNDSLYGDMLDSNVIFPLSVLNLAIKHHIKNYMTMGTSLPKNLNVYSFTKHQFSEFGRFLSDKDKINFYTLQLEMFYGGDNEPQSRFMNMCKSKMIRNERIALTDGTQKRDIVRVEDVVECILQIVESYPFEGYVDLPVGSGESHSIREITSFMKNKTQSSSELAFGAVESREGEPSTMANIDWMKSMGLQLKYPFWTGLSEYCER